MTKQEIKYAKENTKLISLLISFIEYINGEIKDKKE